MWQYSVQLTGHDFEPTMAWSADAQAALAQVKTRADVDLLSWNPADEGSEIYSQYSIEQLVTRIDHTAYARLLEKMAQVVAASGNPVPPSLQRQWYLVGYLAVLSHQTLLNTAAALLGLTVLTLKTPPQALAQAMPQQLRGLTDQARCWLLAAQVTDLQLVATSRPLQTLLQHLLTQNEALNHCCVSGQSFGWQLGNDAYWLSQVERPSFALGQLESPVAYRLIRAAYLERTLG
ncbi:hypothetical protein RA086_10070 [Lactiplantibacillus sp. WILCCON 0030]|uniref:Uncharacterized protein n=1 Tax=Lactiplantibacillus brownii TaxID=3069269 RepID=A0ABU1AAK6_9LACO|nr:hypothetical protein [Lactiplantibacillus brownii]MDQ7937954.1 hypothetical protein [Lactiplantibacillus brownii]